MKKPGDIKFMLKQSPSVYVLGDMAGGKITFTVLADCKHRRRADRRGVCAAKSLIRYYLYASSGAAGRLSSLARDLITFCFSFSVQWDILSESAAS